MPIFLLPNNEHTKPRTKYHITEGSSGMLDLNCWMTSTLLTEELYRHFNGVFMLVDQTLHGLSRQKS